ncbi:MAG: type II toxin-antitoxin system VapB family antitoxin [Ornithinimicrobium sp.]|uniref:type II toxin-antitoxin system VapB family antitoxin n=1 Tax=Ornithinimicrobium sp. TaxID=1977084 RepID=UPI003D9B71D3
MIFKAVGEGRPYPDHGLQEPKDWAHLPPRQIRLEELTTTRAALDLRALLAEDCTFYGDIFCHVVQWRDELYLEDGLHRALRAALQGRPAVHGRVLVLA